MVSSTPKDKVAPVKSKVNASPPTQPRRSKRRPPPPSVPSRTHDIFFRGDFPPRVRGRKVTKVRESPNVFTVDDFLTSNEITHLGKLIANQKLSRSFTDGDAETGVVSTERTSRYLWLAKQQDSIVRNIEERAAEAVGYPGDHCEPLQCVSYTDGQYFNLHHDMGTLLDDGSVEAVAPRRIATLFVYLNTLPDGEGCTAFPELGLNVTPKRGMAVVWCNVQEDLEPDPRVVHKACPVSAGLRKFGLNIWIADSSMQALAAVAPPAKKAKGEPSKAQSAAVDEIMKYFEE